MSCGSLIEAPASNVIVARWMSSTEVSQQQTGAHLATFADLMTELERLGQAAANVGSRTLTGTPYPSRLRPLSNLGRLFVPERVVLHRITFAALDTTLAGSAFQDAPTLTALTNSITPGSGSYTPNDGYMQSRYRFSYIGGWQPNFFRPLILFNDKPFITTDLVTSELGGAGDLAIGLDLPWCIDGSMLVGKLKSIEIFAPAAQWVPDTGKYQRYAILCEMVFSYC